MTSLTSQYLDLSYSGAARYTVLGKLCFVYVSVKTKAEIPSGVVAMTINDIPRAALQHSIAVRSPYGPYTLMSVEIMPSENSAQVYAREKSGNGSWLRFEFFYFLP